MEFSVKCSKSLTSEDLSDLLGKAIVSPKPPLSEVAQVEITNIRNRRLATVNGAYYLACRDIFDSLENLPPVSGEEVGQILSNFKGLEFTTDSLKTYLSSYLEDGIGGFDLNEWGYVTGELQYTPNDSNKDTARAKLEIDVWKSDREGENPLLSIFTSFCKIDNLECRDLMIEDSLQIIKLRERFDFT